MEPLFTPSQLAEVQAYHSPIYTAALVDLIVWPLLLIGTARVLTRPFHSLATRWAKWVNVPVLTRVWKGPEWAETIFFALLYFGFFVAVNLPIDTWFGYVREHEFGMSNESFGTFLFDGLKRQAILVVAVTSLAFGLFGLARRTKSWWWMVGIATSLALVVSTAIDPYRSRLYVDQTSLPQGSLRTRLTTMLDGASIPFSDIFVVHTGARSVRVQAAFAGTGPTRTILLSDTLLETMAEDEVVAAVAHEAGHVSESRWPGWILSPLAVFALMAFMEWLFRRSSQRGWRKGKLPTVHLCPSWLARPRTCTMWDTSWFSPVSHSEGRP